ncbi:MAG: hypothetical protein KDA87_11115 [Planctomycetales bacterium]|nr:hypothetical protein [Planctomycetales bacterium]
MNTFHLGDKVRISWDYFVPELQGVVGIVSAPPDSVKASTGPWQGYWRESRTDSDVERIYWVEDLEIPVTEGAVDGAEVSGSDLTRLA